jgi:hypothetical protein
VTQRRCDEATARLGHEEAAGVERSVFGAALSYFAFFNYYSTVDQTFAKVFPHNGAEIP